MDHKEIRHRLSEYIDGSLTDEVKSEMEAHLRTCSACNNAYRELKKTLENIQAVEEVKPPPMMTQKIMEKVSSEAERNKVFQKSVLPVFIKILLQAIAVLFIAVGVFYIYRSIGTTSRTGGQPVDPYSTGQHAAGTALLQSDRAQEPLSNETNSVLPSQQVPQRPAYKSLDMKPEYVVPSRPDRYEKDLFSEKNEQDKQATPSSANREETEKAMMKKIKDFFISHDLPLLGNIKYYSVADFQAIPKNMSLLDEGMLKKLSSCKKSYQVDVATAKTHLKYVYCVDKTSIKLLFKVDQKSDHVNKN
jgi:hypothetical protein